MGSGAVAITRVLITGCRHWTPHELADEVISRLVAKHGPHVAIVHGACPTGVDAVFDEAARDHGLDVERHPADWDRHGKAAGPVRNEQMVAAGADLCLAIHRSIKTSKGTKHCAGQAIAAGIPTYLIDSERIPSSPRRLWDLR